MGNCRDFDEKAIEGWRSCQCMVYRGFEDLDDFEEKIRQNSSIF